MGCDCGRCIASKAGVPSHHLKNKHHLKKQAESTTASHGFVKITITRALGKHTVMRVLYKRPELSGFFVKENRGYCYQTAQLAQQLIKDCLGDTSGVRLPEEMLQYLLVSCKGNYTTGH